MGRHGGKNQSCQKPAGTCDGKAPTRHASSRYHSLISLRCACALTFPSRASLAQQLSIAPSPSCSCRSASVARSPLSSNRASLLQASSVALAVTARLSAAGPSGGRTAAKPLQMPAGQAGPSSLTQPEALHSTKQSSEGQLPRQSACCDADALQPQCVQATVLRPQRP